MSSTNRISFPAGKALDSSAHAGLLLACGLEDAGNPEQAKHPLLKAAIRASKNAHAYYALAFKRWQVSTQDAKRVVCRTRQRLIVGLGTDNVLETGITLHHTYGTPVIPGSALKGLAAHYCNKFWKTQDTEFAIDGSHYRTLFGGYDGKVDHAGHIRFLDAWILPDSLKASTAGLVLDVMTPHHAKYYMGAEAPTDRDDPNPVMYLSVAGAFDVAVECEVPTEEGSRWGDLALRLLTEALAHSGAGGKTSSGYGRLDIQKSKH